MYKRQGGAATVEAEIEERLDEPSVATPEVASAPATGPATTAASGPATTPADDFADNAALRDWAAGRQGRGGPGQ